MKICICILFLGLLDLVSAQVVITEFMASNNLTLEDENGRSSDWIEIQNQGAELVNLEGWTLSDEFANPTKWTFPSRDVGSGERLIVFASARDPSEQIPNSEELHANFTLSQEGEYLGLFPPTSTLPSSDFAPSYPPQTTDVSYGVGSLGQMRSFDLTPESPEEGVDWESVTLGGSSGSQAISFDTGEPGASQQGYPWFEYRDELDALSQDLEVVSASLVWNGIGLTNYRRLILTGTKVGVFSVPDSTMGTGTIAEPYDGNNIRSYYETHEPLDEIYVSADRISSEHEWDVTALVAKWHENPDFPQKGEFLLLNDSYPIRVFWGNSLQRLPRFNVQAFEPTPGSEQRLFFTKPSPGRGNYDGRLNLVEDTRFSVDRGIFTTAFDLTVSSDTPGATISYTTDGSTPSPSHGTLVPSPDTLTAPLAQISISGTTTLRAMAFLDGWASTNVDTQTYLFTSQVVNQGNSPGGYPTGWKGDGGSGVLPADYEIDSDVLSDPTYSSDFAGALEASPTISLVTDIPNLFDPDTGIYQNPQQKGDEWERLCSMEVLYPNRTADSVQIDCGLRIQGGHTRLPGNNPKHSFRVSFRSEYGDPKFEHRLFGAQRTATRVFDELILRAGGNQSWLHHNTFLGDNRGRAQYLRDQWAKDTQREMGHPATHNMYAHLYINGLYWGVYNPTERATAGFGDEYLNGCKDEMDALNSGRVVSGTRTYFDEMFANAESGLSDPANYQAISEKLDLVSFADYMILNQYGGNMDWDDHNWYAIANRNGGKWHYIAWDSEFFFIELEHNFIEPRSVNADRRPSDLWDALMENDEFRILFMDRVHHHCGNDGLLTPGRVRERWDIRRDEVFLPLIGESARWGDYRRDVHQRGTPTPIPLYDRDEEWQLEYDRLVGSYFPQRTSSYLGHLEAARIQPATRPPVFSQHGGQLLAGNTLAIMSTGGGAVYYTNDGSDPRAEGGDVAGLLYNEPLVITNSTEIRARVRSAGGEWSPLTNATFFAEIPASSSDLVISEIMYNLDGPDDAEFIELWNTSETDVIDLSGAQFLEGISFVFPLNTTLEPNERAILVRYEAAFRTKYGNEVRVLGEFGANSALDNDGDRLVLVSVTSEEIFDFRYGTSNGWPERADGGGSSLILLDSDSYQDPSSWRLSSKDGGSPGAVDTIPFAGDPHLDADNDGLSAGFEYLLGHSDEVYTPLDEVLKVENAGSSVTVTCPLNLFAEGRFLIRYSMDLEDWSGKAEVIDQLWKEEGRSEIVARIPMSNLGYFRIERANLRSRN